MKQGTTMGQESYTGDDMAALHGELFERINALEAENARLRDDQRKGGEDYCKLMERHDNLHNENADLTAKLKLAVEALEHYGNPDTYSDGFHKFGCDAPNIASDALKQVGEQR